MANPISRLFALAAPAQNMQPQSSENIQSGETYLQYGKRVCGIVTGNTTVLAAFLTKVYQTEKNQQVNNQTAQQKIKQGLESNLADAQTKLQSAQAALSNLRIKIEAAQNSISDLNRDLANAQAKDGQENKMSKIKMIIGSIILVVLTFYLFIFYSSTFYSAFLLSANELINYGATALSIAMFNTHALSDAYHDGMGSLLFILCAPIIFMGLGYSLHYFMVQKGSLKWVKAGFMLLLTFFFDCILAYKIGELLYEIKILSSWTEMPPYSFDIAISDINTWAVIFCGFIVYVIWGIVFDMTITAYSELRSNAREINSIKNQIAAEKAELLKLQQGVAPAQADIDKYNSEIENLTKQIQKGVFINPQLMKSALADFFAGWMAIMPQLVSHQTEQVQAQNIYNNIIADL